MASLAAEVKLDGFVRRPSPLHWAPPERPHPHWILQGTPPKDRCRQGPDESQDWSRGLSDGCGWDIACRLWFGSCTRPHQHFSLNAGIHFGQATDFRLCPGFKAGYRCFEHYAHAT